MQLKSCWIRVFGVTFTSFAFFFGRKFTLEKKRNLVQDLIPPPSICIHLCTLCTCTKTYMPRCSASECFWPFKTVCLCLVTTPGLTSECPKCSACMFVRLHTRTPTYTPTPVKKCRIDNTCIFSFLSHTHIHTHQTIRVSNMTPPSLTHIHPTSHTHTHQAPGGCTNLARASRLHSRCRARTRYVQCGG